MATAQREHDDTLAVAAVLLAILWLGPLAVACAVLAMRSAARAGRARPQYAVLALVLGIAGTVAWLGFLTAPPLPTAARTTSAAAAEPVAYAALPGVVELAPAAADLAGTARGDAEPEAAPLVDQASALLGTLPSRAGGYASEGFTPADTTGALESYEARFVAPDGDVVVVRVGRWGTSDEASAHVAVAARAAADRPDADLRPTRVVPGGTRVAAQGTATYLWADFTTTVEVTGERRAARGVAAGLDAGAS